MVPQGQRLLELRLAPDRATPSLENMEISLTAAQVSSVERQVASGRFSSVDEAIRQAVDRLEQDEADGLVGWDIGELRREVQLGIDQLDRGEGIVLETEADWEQFRAGIKARGRARLAERYAATNP